MTPKFNDVKHEVIIPVAFAERARKNPNGSEYAIMERIRKEGWKTKYIRMNSNSKYKNLTYDNMRKHIIDMDGEDALNLKVLDKMRNSSLIQKSRYTFVRKWFEGQYPNWRDAQAVSDRIVERLNEEQARVESAVMSVFTEQKNEIINSVISLPERIGA